jgi:hypothetical protein
MVDYPSIEEILVAESRQFDTTCLKTTKIILGQFVDGPES